MSQVLKIDDNEYKPLVDYFLFRETFKNKADMLTACIGIASAFEGLHKKGLVFDHLDTCDICINPDTAEVIISKGACITTEGVRLGMMGVSAYMAPEAILGQAPDRMTDLYSLAILLFRLMMGGQHPMSGTHLSDKDDDSVYGKDPVFLFDPEDDRNAPVPNMHKNVMLLWHQYPEYVHKMFLAFFGKEGIKNPTSRPSLAEIVDTLVRLRGEMVGCPECKEATVYLCEDEAVCPKCGTKVKAVCGLKTGDKSIKMTVGTTVYKCQLGSEADLYTPLFILLKNKEENIFGLGNMNSKEVMIVTYPGGTTREIGYKKVAPMQIGMKIAYGSLLCEIIA